MYTKLKGPEKMLRGKIAEALVEELLKHSDNQVYHFGYESVLQNLTQAERLFDRKDEIGKRIRWTPDFIVINKAGTPFYVEVKFRWDKRWYPTDLEELEVIRKHWENTVIVMVNSSEKPYFRLIRPPYENKNEDDELLYEPFYKNNDFDIENVHIKDVDNVFDYFDSLVENYYKIK